MENRKSIDLTNLDWYYRGEGNKNLVIALSNNQIVRITKTTMDDNNQYASKLNYKQFVDYLLPLLKNYVQKQQIVYINKEDIKSLEEKLEKYRPKNRLNKCLQYGDVILSPDYTFLPLNNSNASSSNVFCVELKLKQGWIPIGDQHSKCTYCLHQYYKLSRGQILKVSKYCPLNMFSGVQLRMKYALKALLDHPQNNLQIFKNGIVVYADGFTEVQLIKTLQEMFQTTNIDELYEQFYEVIIKMLLKNYNSLEKSEMNYVDNCYSDLLFENSCIFLPENHQLPTGSVLNCLYEIQNKNTLGVFGTYSIYNKLLKKYPSDLDKWDIITIQSRSDIENSIRSILFDYLMFSTFRDCSVMLTFQRNQSIFNLKNSIILNNGIQFETNVGITDLDPKTLNSIKKHWIQRNEGIDAYNTLTSKSSII